MDVSSEGWSPDSLSVLTPLLKAFPSSSFWQGNFKKFLKWWSVSDTGMQAM